MAECNENGVYQAEERIALPRAIKGWKGGDIAGINLACLGDTWIWATDFELHGGDGWGRASPLWDCENRRAPTRAAAIEAASADFRTRLSDRADECRDSRAILAWLDSLAPDQLDLFGRAA